MNYAIFQSSKVLNHNKNTLQQMSYIVGNEEFKMPNNLF